MKLSMMKHLLEQLIVEITYDPDQRLKQLYYNQSFRVIFYVKDYYKWIYIKYLMNSLDGVGLGIRI
ncbi:hypothetical protein PLAN_160015 [Planktothrix rubescens CCAP 1459/22]|uniref:Uncharacterized protein n=1 Tax=Planktothrix rubescens CCAP 1459/22 TaxID=329571 RepID=A0A6J7ZIA2_PLARU|nr:hypothetical protein PLAN_160015 [Planktothrix rubescens NIVA-CYA 18]